ncbi:hypothetical protein [Fonticella tunisiensis]|uniref:Uncharacterized protein n=1 Tax=Fonticella tunisiensis TaxID=1096341 RepID=A0A4R7K5C6_9CLOT|nr:hypothetical protein EDD71_1425 [Fonticella tunisiensis]
MICLMRTYTRFRRLTGLTPNIMCPDYGSQNPTTFGLWGKYQGEWYKVKEYYYSGRDQAKQKTDEEFYQDLEKFVGDLKIKAVIVDPSAASFIATIKKHGKFAVKKAKNDVLDGIRNVSTALNQGMILFNDCCTNTFEGVTYYILQDDKLILDSEKYLEVEEYGETPVN